MATRVDICEWCDTQLLVPFYAQTITCPVCRCIKHLAPPTNNGYYQQPSPPMRYNQRLSRPRVYNHHQLMHPSMNNNNGLPMPVTMYNIGHNQRPSPPSAYNHQQLYPPMNNNNGYYTHQASSPSVNNNNGSYNQQVSTPPVNKNNGYYNQHASTPPMNNNNNKYNKQVSTPQVYGKKRAVLCGISYLNTEHSLEGSVSDVESVRRLLVDRMGFPDSSILILTEVEPNPMRVPTAKNIITALRWLVQGCKAGDSLVFYYTGHGSRVPDNDDDEFDGYDEALCPVDYKSAGKIIDDTINDTIVRPLPRGAQLHTIIDTCYSGTALDLCFVIRMNSRGKYYWEDHEKANGTYQGTNGGIAVCVSACDDHQKSGNTTAFTGNATGALTYSFVKAVQSEPALTYGRLMNSMRAEIRKVQSGLGLNGSNASTSTQEPQMSSSEKFDIYSKKLML